MKYFTVLFLFSMVLNAQTIVFKGLTYQVVISPITGKQWLDRNLGATRSCLSMRDKLCFGDYYQWGRKSNGHEKIANQTIIKKKLSFDSENQGAYVSVKGHDSFDWRKERDDTLWNGKKKKNNICPKGFRVPTMQEMEKELEEDVKGNKIINNITAYKSFLKIPSAGFRNLCFGKVIREGDNGSLWTSSGYEREAYYLDFNKEEAYITTGARAEALPVRCIEDR